jgi:hypothetical protein
MRALQARGAATLQAFTVILCGEQHARGEVQECVTLVGGQHHDGGSSDLRTSGRLQAENKANHAVGSMYVFLLGSWRSPRWIVYKHCTPLTHRAQVVTLSQIFASHPSPQMIRVQDLSARQAASLVHAGPSNTRHGHRAGLRSHFVRRATRPREAKECLALTGRIGTMAAAQATCTQGSGSRPGERCTVRWAASPCACLAADALHSASFANTDSTASVRELGPQIKNAPGIVLRALLDFWLPYQKTNQSRAEGTQHVLV